MSLADMKKPPHKKGDDVCAVESGGERYPYGLSISLDDDSLKKLDISELPQVGEEYIVAGIGVITNVSANSSQRGTNRSVTIQLQKLDVGPVKIPGAVDAVSKAIKEDD